MDRNALIEKLRLLRESLNMIETHGEANLNRLLGSIQYLTTLMQMLEEDENKEAAKNESL